MISLKSDSPLPVGVLRVLIFHLQDHFPETAVPPMLWRSLALNGDGQKRHTFTDFSRYFFHTNLSDALKYYLRKLARLHGPLDQVQVFAPASVVDRPGLSEIIQILNESALSITVKASDSLNTVKMISLQNQTHLHLKSAEKLDSELATLLDRQLSPEDRSRLFELGEFYSVKSDVWTGLLVAEKMRTLVQPTRLEFSLIAANYQYFERFEECAETLLEWQKADPNGSARADLYFGLLKLRYLEPDQRDLAIASEHFDRALKKLETASMNETDRKYDRAVILNGMAYLYCVTKRFDLALSCLEESGEIMKEILKSHARAKIFYPVFLDNFGRLLYDLGQFEKAYNFIAAAVVTMPNFYRYHFHLGLVQLELGFTKLAIESFKVAKEFAPDFLQIRKSLISALEVDHCFEEAASEMIELSDLGEDFLENKMQALLYYFEARNWDKVKTELATIKADPEADSLSAAIEQFEELLANKGVVN